MKIAFIYPKIGMYKELLGTDGYVENMSAYPPLSLAYAAAIARKAGHTPCIIDGNILGMDIDAVASRIKDFSPDILGFTLTAPTFWPVYRLICGLKKIFSLPVIAGGGLFSLYPRETMRHKYIDFGFIGSSGNSLPRFLEAWEKDGDFRAIAGLCFRDKGTIFVNPLDNGFENLDDLPFPARDLLDNSRYHSPFSEKKNFTPFLTSKGCLFRCAYCCLPGQLIQRKPVCVLEELRECYSRFGIRDFDMYDTVFTADKEKVLEICAGIRRSGMKISWIARTHITLVDREILEALSSAGCSMLMYGIESLDEKVLSALCRPAVGAEYIRKKVRETKRAGISAFGFFMLGCPGEDASSVEKTIKASVSLGLDFAQFTRLTPIGGTPLYERYKLVYKQDYWKIAVEQEGDKKEMFPLDTGLSGAEIMRLVRSANIGFYFRFSQMFRIACRVRSPRQLINFLRAGGNILFSFLFRNWFASP